MDNVVPSTDAAGNVVDFSGNAAGFSVASPRGITAFHLVGGTLAKSLVNLAPIGSSAVNATAVGTGGTIEASSPLYGIFTYGNGLKTAAVDSNQMTVYVVFCAPALGGASGAAAPGFGLVFSSSTSNSGGISLWLSATGLFLSAPGGSITTTTKLAYTAGTWVFLAVTIDTANLVATLYDMTHGTSQSYTMATAPVLQGALEFGTTGNGSFSSSTTAVYEAQIQVSNVTHTAQERANAYAGAQVTMTARGITI